MIALKLIIADMARLQKHYEDLMFKDFLPCLISYMLSGPVVCMIMEGKDGNYYINPSCQDMQDDHWKLRSQEGLARHHQGRFCNRYQQKPRTWIGFTRIGQEGN